MSSNAEITELVEGVNAYRVAEFEVSYYLLKGLLQMPPESLILAVRAGDNQHGDTFVIKIADPALPLCPIGSPPRITPTVTKEHTTWDWNVQGSSTTQPKEARREQ